MTSPDHSSGSEFGDEFNLVVPTVEEDANLEDESAALEALMSRSECTPSSVAQLTSSTSILATLPATIVAPSDGVLALGAVAPAVQAQLGTSSAVIVASSWAQPTRVSSTTTTTVASGLNILDGSLSEADAFVESHSSSTPQHRPLVNVGTPRLPTGDELCVRSTAASSSAAEVEATYARSAGNLSQTTTAALSIMARVHPLVGQLHACAVELMSIGEEQRMDAVLAPLVQQCRSRQGSGRSSLVWSPSSSERGSTPFRPQSFAVPFRGRCASSASSRSGNSIPPYTTHITEPEAVRLLVRFTVSDIEKITAFCAAASSALGCKSGTLRKRLARLKDSLVKKDAEHWERALFERYARLIAEGDLDDDTELNEAMSAFMTSHGF
uniref:Uncharacterized protein n=1 Tax=Globodera pallida TaxID=36090 RepID=A0A183CI14_GLOPA